MQIKRISAFLLAIFIVVLTFGLTAFADDNTFSIAVKDAEGNIGEKVRVDVMISNNPGIISINAALNYDENVLKLVSVEDGGILGDEIKHQDALTSPYSLSWANYTTNQETKESFSENGKLCTLVFEIIGGKTDEVTPVSLSLEKYSVMDFDLNDIPTASVNGNVKVLQGKSSVAVTITVLIVSLFVVFGAAFAFFYFSKHPIKKQK